MNSSTTLPFFETSAIALNHDNKNSSSAWWASTSKGISAFSSYLEEAAQHEMHYMNEIEWPDWFWKPLAGFTALALGIAFAIIMGWQHRVNRGRQVAYTIQRNEAENE